MESADLLQGLPAAVQLLDVREAEEYELEHIAGAVNSPLGQLRQRCRELDPEKEVIVYCGIGLRSYLGVRILMQKGFKRVRNLNGGYKVYQALRDERAANGGGEPGGGSGCVAANRRGRQRPGSSLLCRRRRSNLIFAACSAPDRSCSFSAR